MKKVKITGKKKSQIVCVDDPKAKENWALVKIIVAPMCTEYKSFIEGTPVECLGHEAAGEVVDAANDANVKVGDRVVVMPQYPCGKCELCLSGDYIYCENGYDFNEFVGTKNGCETYAQYILKPSWLLPKIPDHISFEHASMLCCGLGPTFGAMQQMGVNSDANVLITGLGPVGLGGIINGIYRGANIIGVSRNKYRQKLAVDLGAHVVLDPDDISIEEKIKALTSGKGVDFSIDCSGNEKAQNLCINSTKRRGQVAFIGESNKLTLDVSNQLIRKGLVLNGIWHYNFYDIPKLFNVVANNSEAIDKLITHKFPMENIEKAWELQEKRQCGKILLYP
jgi:L-iditol 2-dehydrogenase